MVAGAWYEIGYVVSMVVCHVSVNSPAIVLPFVTSTISISAPVPSSDDVAVMMPRSPSLMPWSPELDVNVTVHV